MGVREMERFLEQWQMDARDLRRRLILSPTPRAGAVVRLGHGGGLGRDPHTIGRWAAAFGEGGPAALIFEQSGGAPPALDEGQQAALKAAVLGLPGETGIELANYWNVSALA